MQILNFTIPKYLRDDPFIISLHKQFTKSGVLTKKQTDALEDALEIELDFTAGMFQYPRSTALTLRIS